jgi:hypothetical protein
MPLPSFHRNFHFISQPVNIRADQVHVGLDLNLLFREKFLVYGQFLQVLERSLKLLHDRS